jgi:pyruvate dehydrogenase phosphatase
MSPQRSQVAARLHTPPYVSNIPDVFNHSLRSPSTSRGFLILYSDGLTDLYDGMGPEDIANRLASTIGQVVDSYTGPLGRRSNLSLRLLREALGGDDIFKVSRSLTVEMESRWMDDTTILVQYFQ